MIASFFMKLLLGNYVDVCCYRNDKTIRSISKLYRTNGKMLRVIRNISSLLTFHPLPQLRPGSTCVVVGSSGVLLQFPGLGKVIDNYDYVIRMNFAPTLNFEDFVGSKTFMHFAYLSSCMKALQTNRAVYNSRILFGGKMLSVENFINSE